MQQLRALLRQQRDGVYLPLSASPVSLVSLLELNSHKSESLHSSDSSPALSFSFGGPLANFPALPSAPETARRLGFAFLAFGEEEDVSLDMLQNVEKCNQVKLVSYYIKLTVYCITLNFSLQRLTHKHFRQECNYNFYQHPVSNALKADLRFKAQIPLGCYVTSRHDSTRSTCRAGRDERVKPCCSTSSPHPKYMGSARRTCRVVSCRDGRAK